jgi:hypothetical protein
MKPTVSLRKALSDPGLLGQVLDDDSWSAWRTLLIAAMGEALTADERVVFKTLTGGRDCEPLQRVEEFEGVIGRRGGKSRAISVLATYISGLCRHDALVPGERGVLLIIAQDQKQADIVLDYVEANFAGSPILRQLIESRTARELRLTNRVDIEVRAADFRRLRGPTYVAVIADEVAFWMNENSANPDAEILNAVRPGLATTGGPLFMISSPYARRGELWRTYDKYFGPTGDPLILVAQGSSRTFNPSLPQSVIDRAVERDAAFAAAEYGAEFRRDIESFVSIEAVRACVSAGCYERAPQRDVTYYGFVDPSGGSVDSFALCIGHLDYAKQTVVVDALREVKPGRETFSPEAVCADFSILLRSYGIASVTGDKYAGVWPVEQFSKFGVTYEQSAAPKSDLYRDLLPLINSRRIDLLDHPKMVSQLCSLERRVARGGKDSIDHPPGGHDDVVNAVAGLAAVNAKYSGYNLDSSQPDFIDLDDPRRNDPDADVAADRGDGRWTPADRLSAYVASQTATGWWR